MLGIKGIFIFYGGLVLLGWASFAAIKYFGASEIIEVAAIWCAVAIASAWMIIKFLFYKPKYNCSDLIKSVDELNKEDK